MNEGFLEALAALGSENSVEQALLVEKIEANGEGRAAAVQYHDKVVPMLENIRTHVDSLELMVDDQMWPLPKYRELLFIH